MATIERHADVEWQGSVTEGKGEAKAGTGAFTLPVSFPARIGDPGGKTSPEELMAAAHAACYAMALNGTLGRKNASAQRTVVRATVTADKGDAGIKIAVDSGNEHIVLTHDETAEFGAALAPVVDKWVAASTSRLVDGKTLVDTARATIAKYST